MSANTWEVLDLVARWIHVVAGIMWVGNSMLFNWLDRNLRPAEGRIGRIWLLHSGAFYQVDKTLLAGEPLPEPLHWFKWQAYTTWLSGVALLVAVYWVGGRAAMADPGVHAISHFHATALGMFGLLVGWAVYEGAQRLIASRWPRAAVAVWLPWLVLLSFAFVNHLSGRAAFLHMGALLATLMASNVAMTIVPSQRALVASHASGAPSSTLATLSARAKRVSIHNNYFTFPVIALMVSNHFPAVYGHRWSWGLLLLIIASGAAVRHVLNVRFTWAPWRPALAATIAVSVAAIWAILAMPDPRQTPYVTDSIDRVSFADVRHIIDRRCAACHSISPTDHTFGVAPAGVAFDSPEQIVARAARIHARAVESRTMPPGNKTGITDAERYVLARWIELGASTR